MKIRQAAKASRCHVETIRYYERIGLLPRPARTDSGYREFAPDDIARLRFITRGRELGFSLEEIRSLLGLAGDPALSCTDVDRIARRHLADIHRRISELQQVADELQHTIDHCAGGQRGACAILGALQGAGEVPG